ncbi:MAG TPA: DUF1175 family protein [Myxococcota bacterium]|nr:DUF1175 family protein [Myxococcota bacterium]HRY92371.1 DUF1175 family protein [Myxococcota bacterium]HSA24794.1 DUF1175 family protein [Myxococcota bacterium]
MRPARAPSDLRVGLAALGGLVLLFAASVLVPVSRVASLTPGSLPADPGRSARLVWRLDNVYGAAVPFWPFDVQARVVEGAGRVRLVGEGSRTQGPASLELGLRPAGQAGAAVVELDTGLGRERFSLVLAPPQVDADQDGFPDAAELRDEGDRRAFRAWFTTIAEAQFYAPDPRWEPVHRDCAGLLRFAYKEALRAHDDGWRSRVPYLHTPGPADPRAFRYPEIPLLGERLFRVQPGPYRQEPGAAADFGPTASATLLWEQNCVPLGADAARALAGDLLFFRDPEHHTAPMHSMILLDPPALGRQRRVVYHTGPDASGPGEVRLVRLQDLDGHADDRWHPSPSNPRFLGFYRWKILEGGRP